MVIRRGNLIGLTVVAAAGIGLVARTTVVLGQERPQGRASAASAAVLTVTTDIAGFAFASELAVAPGGTVTWVNRDSAPHSVTFSDNQGSQPPNPSSIELPGGASGTATFAAAGTYSYICTIHPSMRGRVEVRQVVAPTDPYRTTTTGGY